MAAFSDGRGPLLLGMAVAFVPLYHALAESRGLGDAASGVLVKVAHVTEHEARRCLNMLQCDYIAFQDVGVGFTTVKEGLSKMFAGSIVYRGST